MINISWDNLKQFVDNRKLSVQYIETEAIYYLWAFDGPMVVSSTIQKLEPPSSDQTDFENNYKANGNKSPTASVITASEVNDKTLKTFCVFNETDETGLVEFVVPVPQPARYIAYGDIEFKEREFGDYVKNIELVDLNRLLAWQAALANNPEATEPLPDEAMQANGLPYYPVIGNYDEKLADEMQADQHTRGIVKSGMAMTYQYGVTEAEPIGGYGFLPGGFYFRIAAQKATAEAGKKCEVSIDWAEPNV
jgi:hypothetical protein